MLKENKEIHVSNDEKKEGRLLGIICYIFALIPYLSDTDNNFVKFHAKEGMNLLFVIVVYGVLDVLLKSLFKIKVCNDFCIYSTPIIFEIISIIIKLILVAYCIYGIINVLCGKIKHLPLISKINIFK